MKRRRGDPGPSGLQRLRNMEDTSSLSDFRRKSFVFNNGTFEGQKLCPLKSNTYPNSSALVRQTAREETYGERSSLFQASIAVGIIFWMAFVALRAGY